MSKLIKFTPDKLKALKEAYQQALSAGKGFNDSFIFEGDEWVVGYAKYVIQYLEGKGL